MKLVDEAQADVRRRGINDPQLASSLFDTRAAALIQLNRYQEAIANLQAALRLRPGSVKFMQSLRDCYAAIHLTELAEKMDRDIQAATRSNGGGQQ